MKLRSALTSALLIANSCLLLANTDLNRHNSNDDSGYLSRLALYQDATLGIEARTVTKAQVRDQAWRLGYQQWQLEIGTVDLAADSSTVKSSLGIGLSSSRLLWANNPYFQDKTRYNVVVEGTGEYELDLPFVLHTTGELQFDLNGGSLAKNSYALLSIYGSKAYESTTLSLGLYGEVGRHSPWLLPVVGLQTPLYDNLALDLMFPYHAILSYHRCDKAGVFVAVRSLKDRQRVGANKTLDHGIWEYRSNTLAVGAKFNYNRLAQTEFEIGQGLRSSVRCYDTNGHAVATYRTKDSLYAQFSLTAMY